MASWLAAAGAFVVSLDSMMNIAFPSIAGGAVADVVGHVRVFRAGLVLSAIAFVAGGVAPVFGALLAARAVQGFAGGLIYGTAPGIVSLAASPQARGRALGFLNAAIAL